MKVREVKKTIKAVAKLFVLYADVIIMDEVRGYIQSWVSRIYGRCDMSLSIKPQDTLIT